MSDETKSAPEEMHVDPVRAKQLLEGFNAVTSRIASAKTSSKNVRLILVSKLKPASDILALHTSESISPQALHFGENYAQELQHKASILPQTIRWHMIGALQTNKCKPLSEGVRNLWCVSSVDTVKKVDALQKGRAALAEKEANGKALGPLNIQVQVNTSGEENKSGVEPGEASALCSHIRDKCPNLKLTGLMTIGAIARSQATTAETENEDFIKLKEVRDLICSALGVKVEELELGMGMSSDFEAAVKQGSDEVRIGTTIFGERQLKSDAKAKEKTEESQA